MFVKNREKVDFQYRKGSYLAVLKAGTVSYVDETKVSAKELIDCYGQRIDVVSRDIAIEVTPQIKKEEVKEKKVETVKKNELNDSFIEKILGEIKDEENAPKEGDTDTDADTDTDTDTDADTDTDTDTDVDVDTDTDVDVDTDTDVDVGTDTDKEEGKEAPKTAPKAKAAKAKSGRRTKKN